MSPELGAHVSIACFGADLQARRSRRLHVSCAFVMQREGVFFFGNMWKTRVDSSVRRRRRPGCRITPGEGGSTPPGADLSVRGDALVPRKTPAGEDGSRAAGFLRKWGLCASFPAYFGGADRRSGAEDVRTSGSNTETCTSFSLFCLFFLHSEDRYLSVPYKWGPGRLY